MNTEMTDEQRIALCRLHYEAWAGSAGFPLLTSEPRPLGRSSYHEQT